jgi:DUF177 domain-containing protein
LLVGGHVAYSITVAGAAPRARYPRAVGQRANVVDLGRLALSPGEGRRLDLDVDFDALEYGGQRYAPEPGVAQVRVDAARTGGGWSLQLRYGVRLSGPCTRCLEPAAVPIEVDAREVDQAGGGEELRSPYVEGAELDLGAWAHDSLALELPVHILCREDCRGLCPVCGQNLNEEPADHAHDAARESPFARLSELELD